MEAQASDSYPAAADHSNSTMEAQASAAAADHSNRAMEAQAIVAAIQQQQIIATVLWTHRLVTAISSSSRSYSNSAMEVQASSSYPATVQAVVQKLY